jgi:undecaprenyl-phosphate galactose phosphotransferase
MAIEARETVRPGLTGLWQVLGRSDLDLSQLLTLDEAYVANWSLALDVQILLRTPAAVVCRRGAY